MMKFYGEIQKGRLTLPVLQKLQREQFLTNLKDGTQVTETITKEAKSKSHQQVKMHFGLAVSMIRQEMIDSGYGIFNCAPTVDMVHEILTKCCGGVGDGGECLRLSEMSTTQAAAFFENIRDWAATQLHIVIPDPDPNWRETNGH